MAKVITGIKFNNGIEVQEINQRAALFNCLDTAIGHNSEVVHRGPIRVSAASSGLDSVHGYPDIRHPSLPNAYEHAAGR